MIKLELSLTEAVEVKEALSHADALLKFNEEAIHATPTERAQARRRRAIIRPLLQRLEN